GGNDWNQGGQDWNNWNQGGQDWNNWNQGGQDWNNWNQGGQDWNNWNQGGQDWNNWNQGQQNFDWNQGGNNWNQGQDWNNWSVNDWNNNNGQQNFDWNNGGQDWSSWNQGGNDWNQQSFDWNNGGQQNFDWNQGGNDWNQGGNDNWYNWDVNNWSQGGNDWNQGGQQNFNWNQGGQQNNDWGNWNQGGNDWSQGGQQQVNNGGAQVQAGKKLCAISFDDGASAQSKSDPAYRIIDALIKNNMTATFFIVSDWIKTNEQVQYEYQNGMEVANHTKSHQSLGSLGSSQIRSEWEQCNSKLKSIIGTEPSHLMRLPYLESNGTVQSALYDIPLISCAIDTQDWNNASKDQIVNTIKQAAQNGSLEGAIVLCHENYATTAAAMEEVLPWLAQNGYQNVNISDMAAAKGKTLAGGQIHTRV
ncbi:polysaccharide deacetylase family protein, partial [uncultured Ruminococcus sp.]|uniref:polysaccharide deacetylase family protein n=1 Tax=uncultured Ruminococcus sp. TaxID=165186 RepID=UPI0025E14651